MKRGLFSASVQLRRPMNYLKRPDQVAGQRPRKPVFIKDLIRLIIRAMQLQCVVFVWPNRRGRERHFNNYSLANSLTLPPSISLQRRGNAWLGCSFSLAHLSYKFLRASFRILSAGGWGGAVFERNAQKRLKLQHPRRNHISALCARACVCLCAHNYCNK